MRRLLLLSILAIAACDAGLVPTSGASPALVIRQGQTAAGDLVAGRYRLMWNAPGCTELTVQWVSDTGKGWRPSRRRCRAGPP